MPTLNSAAELGLPVTLNECPAQALKNDLEKHVAGMVVWGDEVLGGKSMG